MTTATTETTQAAQTIQTTQLSPDATHLTVSSPGAVEPGFTSQLFVVAEAALRITDVRGHDGCEAVRLIAGSSETVPEEGVSWAEHLESEDVRVEKGQYITVVGRNVANAKQRIRASVRTIPVAGSASARTSVSKTFKIALSKGPEPIAEPGAPVRFILERGYVPYALAFVREGTPVPRSVRGALVSAFDSHHAIRKEGDTPLPRSASAVEVVLPAVLRERVGFAIRSMLPLQLHADDRRAVVEAIEDALTSGQSTVHSPQEKKSTARSPQESDTPCGRCGGKGKIATYEQINSDVRPIVGTPCPDCSPQALKLTTAAERIARLEEENVFMRNSILALEKRVADLESPDCGLKAEDSPQ